MKSRIQTIISSLKLTAHTANLYFSKYLPASYRFSFRDITQTNCKLSHNHFRWFYSLYETLL